MRILFVSVSAKTHLYGMTALGWALRAAGHDVRVAAVPAPGALSAEDAAHTGLPFVPIGRPVDLGALAQDMATLNKQPETGGRARSTQTDYVREYLRGDPQDELALFGTAFRHFCPQEATDDLAEMATSWGADLIVWDYMMMFGGPLAARRSGAAHARLVFGTDCPAQLRAAWAAKHGRSVADPLELALGDAAGAYGRDFTEDQVYGQWSINSLPPWAWRPDDMTYVNQRPVSFNGPSIVPDWVSRPSARPRVCVTLGLSTRDVTSIGITLDGLLDAVSDLDVEVVATVPPGQVEHAGRIPDNVRFVDFVPLVALLPTCSAVVHHGGPQTVAAALEHAVPQMVVPSNFNNQRWWGPVAQAESLADKQAGLYPGNSDHVSPEDLRAGLRRMVTDELRNGAASLRDEYFDIPSPTDVVPVLEQLTVEHRGVESQR